MLPAARRLRRSADFDRAVRAGRRSAGSAVVVHHLAGAPAAGCRVGFVVSKAVGGAVVRNRVRRRLRESVRARLDRLPAGLLVVRATPKAAASSYRALDADLERCLSRLGRPSP